MERQVHNRERVLLFCRLEVSLVLPLVFMLTFLAVFRFFVFISVSSRHDLLPIDVLNFTQPEPFSMLLAAGLMWKRG
jgi:hypothetical protein